MRDSLDFTSMFSDFVVNQNHKTIPPNVIKAATHAFTDTIGVGIGGSHDDASNIAARWVLSNNEGQQSRLWARGCNVTSANAAFVNAIQSHVLDYDDSSINLRGHPSATLVAVAVAVGESTGASGLEVLTAYAIGLEVSTKLSPALGPKHYFRGWHTSATVGIFGATSVAAKLLGLNKSQLCHAWGIAASQSSGLTRNFGTMTKALHIGNAARNGVIAAQLAKDGFTSDTNIFDGSGGFVDVYTGYKKDGGDQGDATESDQAFTTLGEQVIRLASPWELLDPGLYVKRWPCCYASHRPIAGMINIMSRYRLDPDNIVSIDIGFLPGATHPLNHSRPKNELEAKFSVEYPIAAVILDGKIDLESFEDQKVLRPAAQKLISKVGRFSIPDEKTYNGLTGYNIIRIRTTNDLIEEKITCTPGAPYEPMSDQDRAQKFLSCAAKAMDEVQAKRLLEKTARLANLETVLELWS